MMPQFEHKYYATSLDIAPPIVAECDCCGYPIYLGEEIWRTDDGRIYCDQCIHPANADYEDGKAQKERGQEICLHTMPKNI